MYTGAAMQLALQHGLHTTFEKADGAPESTNEASVARVWAYLEFVCHWYDTDHSGALESDADLRKVQAGAPALHLTA